MTRNEKRSDAQLRSFKLRLLILAFSIWTVFGVGSFLLAIYIGPLWYFRYIGEIGYSTFALAAGLLISWLLMRWRNQFKIPLHREVAGAYCSNCSYSFAGLEPTANGLCIICPECGQPHVVSSAAREELKVRSVRVADILPDIPFHYRVLDRVGTFIQGVEKTYRTNPGILIGIVMTGSLATSYSGSRVLSDIQFIRLLQGLALWMSFWILAEVFLTAVQRSYRQRMTVRFRAKIEEALARQ